MEARDSVEQVTAEMAWRWLFILRRADYYTLLCQGNGFIRSSSNQTNQVLPQEISTPTTTYQFKPLP